ncbi:translocation protein S66 [Xylographa bjoerkii]|nr:translocation protein S66 [Xylographa bjoerkii]
MVDWISLAVPFAYLGILIGSLATFSSLYRARKASKSASLAPWFPAHLQRNIYLSLLHLDQPSPTSDKALTVPDSILKAALLRRATEDIHRIISVRSAKQALSTLLARGSVGDELWQRFLRAEKEMEEELKDVVQEANALAPNWGATIFQSANEMATNAVIRKRVEEVQAQAKLDREWWDRKRETTRTEFMKELDIDDEKVAEKGSDRGTGTSTPARVSRPMTAGGEKGSDEDTVLVESGGPTTPGGTVGKAGAKKRKGKK